MQWIMLLVSLLGACDRGGPAFEEVDVMTLWKAKQEGALIVDVRRPDQYAEAHIQGSANIPLNGFTSEHPTMAAHPEDQPIYVICASGQRGKTAARILAEEGRKVKNVKGGLIDWVDHDLPFVSPQAPRPAAEQDAEGE